MGPARQPDEPLEPAPDPSASAVAWRALTSSGALAALLAVIGVLVSLSMLVPARATSRELHEALPYALAELIDLFGLADPLTAWPVLLLGLLTALVSVGVLVRRSLGPSAAEPLGAGPWVETASVALDVGPDVARQRLIKSFGKTNLTWRQEPGGVISTRRGAWSEGFGVFVLGGLALVAAAVVGRASGLDGQISVTAGDPGASSVVMKARSGDRWVDRVLPVRLSCEAAQPLDPLRRHRCLLVTGDGSHDVVLQPGKTTSVGPVHLTPLSARPLPLSRSEPIETLVSTATNTTPKRLTMPQGTTLSLQDTGELLTGIAGPDGPMVVATRAATPDALGTLLLPASMADPAALESGLRLASIDRQRLTIAVHTEPQRYLRYAALLLFVLGMVLMTLRPALTIRISPTITADRAVGSRIDITSTNRRGTAARLRTRLEEAT